MGENKKKSGKKLTSIIILVLTIILCLSEITGLTLALFTNQDDGKIGITTTSGKCEVDIVDSNGASLVGDVLDFVTQDNRNQILFEPGAAFYTESFVVKNKGNIPVNIRIYVSEDEDYEWLAFETAFEFWITKDPTNPNAEEKLMSFGGSLEVGQETDPYYLVIKMKETAGNEYMGKSFRGIGITVYAVQGNVN